MQTLLVLLGAACLGVLFGAVSVPLVRKLELAAAIGMTGLVVFFLIVSVGLALVPSILFVVATGIVTVLYSARKWMGTGLLGDASYYEYLISEMRTPRELRSLYRGSLSV